MFSTGLCCHAQKKAEIFTADVDNFWQAFDKLVKENDTTAQLNILDSIYIKRATEGLRAFMEERQLTKQKWLKAVKTRPKFMNSVRNKTYITAKDKTDINNSFKKFASVYPKFSYPKIFFTIGAAGTGGTTQKGKIIIGTEVVVADSTSDLSEFPLAVQNIFKIKKTPVYFVTHEAAHTQQMDGSNADLLGACMREGICDLIAEILLNEKVNVPYMQYGRQHEKELWTVFKTEMGSMSPDWLYNAMRVKDKPADLGYFMGYAIAKSYYEKQKDKNKAIATLIEINYENKEQYKILEASGYASKFE